MKNYVIWLKNYKQRLKYSGDWSMKPRNLPILISKNIAKSKYVSLPLHRNTKYANFWLFFSSLLMPRKRDVTPPNIHWTKCAVDHVALPNPQLSPKKSKVYNPPKIQLVSLLHPFLL